MQLPHHSFVFLHKSLAGYRRPREPFDPAGDWEHEYTVLAPYFAERVEATAIGRVHLARHGAPDGDTRLEVTSETNQGEDRLRVEAELCCSRDELASPVEWTRASVIVDAEDRPRALTRSRRRMTRSAWEREHGGGSGGALTSDWSLLEALQRLPPAGELRPERFDLLEDLELLKRDQRLERVEPIEVALGGERTRLSGHVRTGYGTLPVFYWLDETGRLLFVLGSMRALVWVR